jgi:uncharacterized protein (UPF0128 family)
MVRRCPPNAERNSITGDCIISDFHKRNLLKVLEPKKNKMGWGWDLVMNAISFIISRPVIRDYAHQIQHVKGTNYNKDAAAIEMENLQKNLPEDLKLCVTYIKGDREKLISYFE